jgi:hypothetical protein
MSANAFVRSVFLVPCLMASGVAAASVTISPSTTQTINENATLQFKASVASAWAASCGAISSTGLYRAALYPATCTITAKATSGGSTASVKVTVVSPVMMSPVAAATPQHGTQQFTASAGVTWTASCGSITAGGLYTASGSVGNYCTVEGTAVSGTKYHVYGYDHILAPVASLTVSPVSAAVNEGATQQFTTSASATWSASCGSVTSAGLYTAPLVAEACMVTATPTAGGSAASAAVTVSSPITITPASATTSQSWTQQFSASAPVIWMASCGSISSSGLFTASGAQGAVCSIQAMAASGPAYTAMVKDTIGPTNTFTISPTSAAVSEGATQQFTANAAATWSVTCGSITSAGLYTAPLTAESCAVTASSTGSGQTSMATVVVSSPITITPSNMTTDQNGSQQFTASQPVTWSASCGSISTSGLFTASGTPGAVCSIQATAASGTAYTATASDTIAPPNVFTISPTSATVSEDATQQFTANASATWSASCGSVDASGLYTAPLVAEACTVTATPTGGSALSAGVTVTSPITIMPAAVNLHALNSESFTASQAVTWTANCGSISSSGGFTAPPSAGNCTVTATASSGTAFTAVATANVDVVNYTSWKGGGGNTGAQTDELVLTPANVNSSSFGINWTASVDSLVTAQPLYMNGLMIDGVPHNVVFIATNNDSVYAFDGDTGAPLWQVSLIPSGATSVAASSIGYTSVQQQFGIMGTPVIDPTTNTMYVVAETSEQSATYFPHRLHALDVTTGAEKFGGPVLISNPQMQPAHKLQRPGLLLAGGVVYVGIGSLQDKNPYNGLLFAFNAATLAQQALWVPTSTGSQGGIWMGGAAPSIDEDGNIYVATGNGTFDGTTNFGESTVKLSPGLQVLDYFAPYNYAAYDSGDLDLGSSGVIVVPDQIGGYPHELITCGKAAPIYVLDRDNLSQVGTTSDNVIQVLSGQVGVPSPGSTVQTPCLAAPALWGENVYFGGKNDVLKMFTLNASTGMLSSTPASQDVLVYGYPGADPVISSNGATDGIVWTIDTGTGTLRANDATNVANVLFSGALAGGAWNWTVPTVVNGHVYAAEKGMVFAFGLNQ